MTTLIRLPLMETLRNVTVIGVNIVSMVLSASFVLVHCLQTSNSNNFLSKAVKAFGLFLKFFNLTLSLYP